jgi:hypothetical protein
VILLGSSVRLADFATIGRWARPLSSPSATAERIDVVPTDDVSGAEFAARHLLELGHGRILRVDDGLAPVPRNGDTVTVQRCAPQVWGGWLAFRSRASDRASSCSTMTEHPTVLAKLIPLR